MQTTKAAVTFFAVARDWLGAGLHGHDAVGDPL
jgi:hypothetical protein